MHMSAPEKSLPRLTGMIRPTGLLYFLYAALTAAASIIGLLVINARSNIADPNYWPSLFINLGEEAATVAYLATQEATIMPGYLPDSFVFLDSIRNYAMPEAFLPYFFYILLVFAGLRIAIGLMSVLFGSTPGKGSILGLFAKIDLWFVIPIGFFTLFFFDGLSFIWFPIISIVPCILLLSGSAKTDTRPGIASRAEARTAKVFLIPAYLGLTFMTYIPLTAVFGISLFEWQIPFAPVFAGLKNITDLFSPGSFFWRSAGLTFLYAFLAVVIGMVYSMIVALLLNRKIPGEFSLEQRFTYPL